MNLVVDYGNTLAKVGVFDEHTLIRAQTFDNEQSLKIFLENFSADNFILSSVARAADPVLAWAQAKRKFTLTTELPLPIQNLYATPHTLGVDRIAGICGAHQRFKNSDCVVIDTGTCVTYDFLDREGKYHGGSISPGMQMRFQAMHSFTAKLPRVAHHDNPPLIGNTTEMCMQSGVVHGMTEEINGIIMRYRQKFGDIRAILCGGDALFFENKLKGPIFAIPELVLSGLNSILIYNVGS